MKNPFPGMNPYLELRWQDVHTRLMVYICDAMTLQLPPGLRAFVEQEVQIGGPDDSFKARPDAHVVEIHEQSKIVRESRVATTEPTVVVLDDAPPHRWVEIVDVNAGDRVVTAIELLSPTNKGQGDGRDRYRAKQQAYATTGVNLVEIDLLRGGDFVLLPGLSSIPRAKRGPYNISVLRARPRRYEIYSVPLRNRLPVIAVPLRRSDADAGLDLQQLVNEYHLRSGFGSGADFASPLDPPLSPEEAAWSDSLLAEQGLR